MRQIGKALDVGEEHRDPPALAAQRELAREVAGIIRSRIAPSDRTTLPPIEQTNAAAYEAYVKGRYFMQRPSEESWAKSRDFFEQSIAADPDFALAYVGLSNYYGAWEEWGNRDDTPIKTKQ